MMSSKQSDFFEVGWLGLMLLGVGLGVVSLFQSSGILPWFEGSLAPDRALSRPALASTPHEDHTGSPKDDAVKTPVKSGQAAFGAIHEIVDLLMGDPDTDWDKVNIPALRQHLIDMHELTLHVRVKNKEIPGGLRMTVTGTGRTLGAIHRMVPRHARMTLQGRSNWKVSLTKRRDGVTLTVTSSHPGEPARIQALGFMGLMTVGSNHPKHHLMIAKGIMSYPTSLETK